MRLQDRFSNFCFQLVHRHNLVYNTCWEDPRLDRQALNVRPTDEILVITSAGCNALDYALLNPRKIHCVDMNPRQNALLALKIAGIKSLSYDDFFDLFGRGSTPRFRALYEEAMRSHLHGFARSYWDRYIRFFRPGNRYASFYFRGTAGYFAKTMNRYADRVLRIRDRLDRILGATSIDEQREIYERDLKSVVWTGLVRWFVGRDSTLSLLGVPRPQREQVEKSSPGGIARYIENCVEAVFTQLPLQDNYFWRVYLTGEYTADCCPEYLKPACFAQLKSGMVDRIEIHTESVTRFLRQTPGTISRFVLLDHMDWMSTYCIDLLREEWQALLDRAEPDARFLWRSGGTNTDFIPSLAVSFRDRTTTVGDVLTFESELADRLHANDRVHTYGCFRVAQLNP